MVFRRGVRRFVKSSYTGLLRSQGLKSLKEASSKVTGSARSLDKNNKIPSLLLQLNGGETVDQYKRGACHYILTEDSRINRKMAR